MNQQDELPVAYTTFCDDLRQEVGNKISYMGVYQGMMLVHAFPVALPKLCAAVTARFPRERAPTVLAFKLFLQDVVIAERSLDPSQLISQQRSEPGANAIFATALFHIAPFLVEEPALLKSRVYFDDHELKAGAIGIRPLADAADLLIE
jgi:hypothetical protein